MPADYRPAPPALRLAGVLATLAALAVLGWVIAYWGWRWLGPSPQPAQLPGRAEPAAPAIVAAHLFGSGAPAPTSRSQPSGSASSIRPIGVFAGRDGRGEALLRVGASAPVLVRAGDPIEPGTLLRAVEPNAIVVVEAGVERRIELRPSASPSSAPAAERAAPAAATPGRPAPPASGTPASPTSAVGARVTACAPPAGTRSELYVLRGELLAGMIREPKAWRDLLRTRAGAVTIVDSSGFTALLGLRTGDRLERANGVALLSYEDVAASVLKPLTGSERVTVTGTRDGQTRAWVYVNAASCAG